MKVVFLNKVFFICNITLLLILCIVLNLPVQQPPEQEVYLDPLLEQQTLQQERIETLKMAYLDKKLIVMTFDDGPSKYTESLLEELSKRDVPATFFILGENAIKQEDILSKIVINNEIAVHSYTHKLFTKLRG